MSLAQGFAAADALDRYVLARSEAETTTGRTMTKYTSMILGMMMTFAGCAEQPESGQADESLTAADDSVQTDVDTDMRDVQIASLPSSCRRTLTFLRQSSGPIFASTLVSCPGSTRHDITAEITLQRDGGAQLHKKVNCFSDQCIANISSDFVAGTWRALSSATVDGSQADSQLVTKRF